MSYDAQNVGKDFFYPANELFYTCLNPQLTFYLFIYFLKTYLFHLIYVQSETKPNQLANESKESISLLIINSRQTD